LRVNIISVFLPFNTVDTGVITGTFLSGGTDWLPLFEVGGGVELDCERFE